MPTHVETAKGIVHEWFRWADAGGYIGHLDTAARIRLEAAIAGALANVDTRTSGETATAEMIVQDNPPPRPKRKPKGDAA